MRERERVDKTLRLGNHESVGDFGLSRWLGRTQGEGERRLCHHDIGTVQVVKVGQIEQ